MEGFGRAWSDGEFAALLLQDPVFGFVARPQGRLGKADGFVLTRLTAGEAEILTITVARQRRGRGIGRALMDAILRRLHSERAKNCFWKSVRAMIAPLRFIAALDLRKLHEDLPIMRMIPGMERLL